MIAGTRSKMLSALVAGAMFMTACSGGSDAVTAENSPLFDEEANAPIEQIDEGSGGVAAGPIPDLLTIQPSFGFGAYSVDARTGQASAVPGVAAVETVNRNDDVIVSGNSAFALGGKTREGQTFASDVSIVKFDYESGEVRQLAALGYDRETDGSDDSVSHRLLAVAGNSVVVSAGSFGGEDTITVYDAETGAETGAFEQPRYEFESDSGSCSGGVSDYVGLSDGRLAGIALNSPAIIDLESGDIELMIGCDQDEPELIDFVAPADITDYAVFNVGSSPTDEDTQWLLETEITPDEAFVEGDGDLFWISTDSRVTGEVRAILGGVVQFDLATQQVEAVHSLGVHLGAYVDCDDDNICETTSIRQAQLRYIDGRLVIVDGADDGRVLILDPPTGDLTTIELDRKDADYTRADLLTGDRDDVWLQVSRMTIVSQDASSRQSVGDPYIELLDLETGQITLSLLGEDIFR